MTGHRVRRGVRRISVVAVAVAMTVHVEVQHIKAAILSTLRLGVLGLTHYEHRSQKSHGLIDSASAGI
jgi:hypothetical protein